MCEPKVEARSLSRRFAWRLCTSSYRDRAPTRRSIPTFCATTPNNCISRTNYLQLESEWTNKGLFDSLSGGRERRNEPCTQYDPSNDLCSTVLRSKAHPRIIRHVVHRPRWRRYRFHVTTIALSRRTRSTDYSTSSPVSVLRGITLTRHPQSISFSIALDCVAVKASKPGAENTCSLNFDPRETNMGSYTFPLRYTPVMPGVHACTCGRNCEFRPLLSSSCHSIAVVPARVSFVFFSALPPSGKPHTNPTNFRHAPPKDETIPVVRVADLPDADGILFGEKSENTRTNSRRRERK